MPMLKIGCVQCAFELTLFSELTSENFFRLIAVFHLSLSSSIVMYLSGSGHSILQHNVDASFARLSRFYGAGTSLIIQA